MQKMKPYFSIVIPTLNEEKTIGNLLTDLKKQTLENFEVIVVDGKSQDKTVVSAKRFEKDFEKIKVISSDKKGVCYQRNLGVKNSVSDWIIFFDADNRIPPYFLQGIKFWVEMYKPDILSSWFTPDSSNRNDKVVANISNLYIDLQKKSSKPTTMEAFLCFKKTSFNKLKGFNEELSWGEGSEILKRASKLKMKYYFVKHPQYTYSFRRLRKMGTLGIVRKIAILEFNRMVKGKHFLSSKTKFLYPMEGGEFYELDEKTGSRFEKIFLKLIDTGPKEIIKNGKDGIRNRVYRIFGRS